MGLDINAWESPEYFSTRCSPSDLKGIGARQTRNWRNRTDIRDYVHLTYRFGEFNNHCVHIDLDDLLGLAKMFLVSDDRDQFLEDIGWVYDAIHSGMTIYLEFNW